MMGKPNGKPRIEMRRLSDLKAFPLQPLFFDDQEDEEFLALADDIQRNGLREKPEILPKNAAGYPANSIISGHRRKRALLHNGETETQVLVRYDLASADAATIEKLFLEANQNRRHLDPLAKARVGYRLFEIEKGRERGESLRGDPEESELRDRVGRILDMSGRNLQRYINVLRGSTEIQNALRRREVPLVIASRISTLDQQSQAEIAERIRNGEEPSTVVNAYLETAEKKRVTLFEALKKFSGPIQRFLATFNQRRDEFNAHQFSPYRRAFEQLRSAIDDMLNADE
jgi:hypothetical protein